jgi:hypothetical protein
MARLKSHRICEAPLSIAGERILAVAVGVKAERHVHASGQMRAKIKQTTSCGVMIADDVRIILADKSSPARRPTCPNCNSPEGDNGWLLKLTVVYYVNTLPSSWLGKQRCEK